MTVPHGFNGIDATSGAYLAAPTVEDISRAARATREPSVDERSLADKQQRQAAHLSLPFGMDPNDLEQVGWGIVFAHDAPPEIADALELLCDRRQQQAGARYKSFTGASAYRPDERAIAWLGRQGAGLGMAQVNKVPYYLLIVGSPESIPFRFQYELELNYAVGRLHFDSVQEYRNYAESVVASEENSAPVERRASLFGVCNLDDRATELSSSQLVAPLADQLQESHPDWTIDRIVADQATKAGLSDCLSSSPALLFTASHGIGFPRGHENQLACQGALLCQDWQGPLRHRGAVGPELYFGGDDVPQTVDLSRTLAFHFACYGAGTPLLDDYAPADARPPQIADAPFIARLPQRLLGKPDGGALAVIGHVERAWSYSFSWPGLGSQTHTFENCLRALMAGARVGFTMDAFAMKHADLAIVLNGELADIRYGASVDDYKIAGLWTAHNDARSYLLLGDPAVRIPV
ncbi:hypothetical protein [Lysobacter sp. CA199]|uniref:hypothetical protein n=1 Tax=Lysobacter sp. CA199 TaxID=3455608 RepID=UPI003F8D6745